MCGEDRKLCYLYNEEIESCRIFDESNKRVTEVNSEYGFFGGNNAYCGNEILKAINCNSLPILRTDGFLLGEDSLHVTFYLVLHTDIGEIKTPLYSDTLKISEIGGVHYND